MYLEFASKEYEKKYSWDYRSNEFGYVNNSMSIILEGTE